MTYLEVLSHIYALGRFGMKPGLDRISRLLDALGKPQDAFAAVHVVGTNGKGSTASFLSSILRAGGYRTGLFTSPHLISFTERFRINGSEIDEDAVLRLADKVMSAAPPETTFFEIITALAALHFAEAGVDIAVIEAGMGGGADATSAFNGLLTMITPISLEHTEYLGGSIEEIAAEKSRICKAGAPIVSALQHPAAGTMIARRAAEITSPLYRCGQEFAVSWAEGQLTYRGIGIDLEGLKPGLRGRYQGGNAAVALASAEILAGAGFPVGREAMVAGVEGASWPGRLELFAGTPRILLDGAHNPAGAEALAEALGEISRRKVFMVIGVMGDKDLSGLLSPLLPLAERVFTVAPALERALPPSELADYCRRAGASAEEAGSVGQGLDKAREAAGADDLVLVCGSLFTVGEARSLLLSRKFEPFRG